MTAPNLTEARKLADEASAAWPFPLGEPSRHANMLRALAAEAERLTDDRNTWAKGYGDQDSELIALESERDALKAEVERLRAQVAPLQLETAEEARKDRAHAEAYYRQAERLLTANERTLHDEVSRFRAQVAHLVDDLTEEVAGEEEATYYRLRDGKDVLFSNMVGACARLLAAFPAAPAQQTDLCGNCAADGKCMKRQALCVANGTPPSLTVGERAAPVIASTLEDRDQAIRVWHLHCDPFKSLAGDAPASVVIDAMIDFARQAQPAAQAEPVAWVHERAISWLTERAGKASASITTKLQAVKSFERPMALYAAPPSYQPAQGVGVTDADIEAVFCERLGISEVLEQTPSTFVACKWFIRGYRAALAQAPGAQGVVLPSPGSPEASAMIDSVLAEYDWPANSKNAARAGYVAAKRMLAQAPAAEPLTTEQIALLRPKLSAATSLLATYTLSEIVRAAEAAHGIGAAKEQP